MFASPEVETFWTYTEQSLESLVELSRGLSDQQLNWRPEAAEPANSLYVLAWHTLGSIEEGLLFRLCGEPGERDRDSEFVVSAAAAALEDRWSDLRERLASALPKLEPGALDRTIEHSRRGPLAGREMMLIAARHAAEHLGQAELTRDLLGASG